MSAISDLNTALAFTIGDEEETCILKTYAAYLNFLVSTIEAGNANPAADYHTAASMLSKANLVLDSTPPDDFSESVLTDLSGLTDADLITLLEASCIIDEQLFLKVLDKSGLDVSGNDGVLLSRLHGRELFALDSTTPDAGTLKELATNWLQSAVDTGGSDSWKNALRFLAKDKANYDGWPSFFKDKYVFLTANKLGTEFMLADRANLWVFFFSNGASAMETVVDISFENWVTSETAIKAYFTSAGITVDDWDTILPPNA